MFGRIRTPKTLQELGNCPPVLEETPARKFSSLYGAATVQSARWFVFSVLQLLVILALAVAIWQMTPLVRTVPYLIKVDEKSGQLAARPVAAAEFKVESRFIEAEARAFVRNLMTLDPFLTRSNLESASARTTGKAAAELREYLATERPFERLAKTHGLVRSTDVTSIDASQKNLVFVFAQTNERVSAGEPIVTRWRFTIHYVIEPGATPKALADNPLGFLVTHFERMQEAAK